MRLLLADKEKEFRYLLYPSKFNEPMQYVANVFPENYSFAKEIRIKIEKRCIN